MELTPHFNDRIRLVPGPSRLAICLVLCLGSLAPCSKLRAAERTLREYNAFQRILGDEVRTESALYVCRRVKGLTPEQQYAELLKHVFPAPGQLCIAIDFTPSPESRLVSPAMLLVEAAANSNRLNDLQAVLETLKTDSLLARKNQSAMRILIHQQRGDADLCLKELDQLLRWSAEPHPADLLNRGADLVVFEVCLQDSQCREAALPLIERIIGLLRQERRDSSIWGKQVRSRRGLALIQSLDAATATVAAAPQWYSASRVKAQTSGLGGPASRWWLQRGRAENFVSHNDDFLYFASPLAGEYQVECDTAAFNWQETRLFACGQWVSPIYTLSHFEAGDLQDGLRTFAIDPPLMRLNDQVHLRIVATPDELQAYVSGRLIHRVPRPIGADPWIGLRSGEKVEGWAGNVRVTGNPVIPGTIDLSAGPTLNGWLSYFPGESRPGLWQKTSDGMSGACLAESGRASVPTHQEELLYYHRPMFENGTIEYEFYYQTAESSVDTVPACVHPALDRLCLILTPEGVAEHWLTDGPFDRTDRLPENAQFIPEHQRINGPLPLKNAAWNHVALTVAGDILRLDLNGQRILERPIEMTNSRRFGFFYYADQEQAQVRNVRWSGHWPKVLPFVADQFLAVPDHEALTVDAGRLTAEFEHDFTTQGFPEDRFSLVQGKRTDNFNVTEQGVRAQIANQSGYLNATFSPEIRVSGDFDIIAEYTDLTTMPNPKGSSTVMLVTFFDNSTQDEAFIARRHMLDGTQIVQQIGQCATVSRTLEGEKRSYFATQPMEESSGRLRLVRRGNMLYYLSAEGNSPNFRLRATREVSQERLAARGVRLIAQIHGLGETAVTWKHLSVRAEKVIEAKSDQPDDRIAELNQQRDQLPVHVKYDFTQQAPSDVDHFRWGDLRPWNQALNGLPIHADGSQNWASSGISLRRPIHGDFDFQAEFEVIQFAHPTPGQETGVFLQLDANDERQTQQSTIFSLKGGDSTELASQIRTLDAQGKPSYRNSGWYSAENAVLLRVSRRGKVLTVIERLQDALHEKIITRCEFPDDSLVNAKFLLHTGGPDRASDVLLKSLRIDAQQYDEPALILPGGTR